MHVYSQPPASSLGLNGQRKERALGVGDAEKVTIGKQIRNQAGLPAARRLQGHLALPRKGRVFGGTLPRPLKRRRPGHVECGAGPRTAAER